MLRLEIECLIDSQRGVCAQIQILGYNSELYGNMTQAIHSTAGLAMFAVLVQVCYKEHDAVPIVVSKSSKPGTSAENRFEDERTDKFYREFLNKFYRKFINKFYGESVLGRKF